MPGQLKSYALCARDRFRVSVSCVCLDVRTSPTVYAERGSSLVQYNSSNNNNNNNNKNKNNNNNGTQQKARQTTRRKKKEERRKKKEERRKKKEENKRSKDPPKQQVRGEFVHATLPVQTKRARENGSKKPWGRGCVSVSSNAGRFQQFVRGFQAQLTETDRQAG